MEKLTIFYDGNCPLCCFEMDKLSRNDEQGVIALIDIQSEQFTPYEKHVSRPLALAKIHGLYEGKVISGIDINYHAWTLVGKGQWVWPLKAPVLRQISQVGYFIFAKFRHPISRVAAKIFKLKTKLCVDGVCNGK